MKLLSNRVLSDEGELPVQDFLQYQEGRSFLVAREIDGNAVANYELPDASEMVTEEQEPENQQLELYRQQLLEDARQQAAQILADAQAEAEVLRAEARDEGYAFGLESGREEGIRQGAATYEEQINSFMAEASDKISEIERLRDEKLAIYMDELKDVAITVAEKVIHVSLQSSGEIIRKMLANEAEKHKATAWVKIYIDRRDYERMVMTDAEMAEELSRLSGNIKFVVLDDKSEGYLLMETPEEIVDMSIDTQMDNIRDRLRSERVGGPEADV